MGAVEVPGAVEVVVRSSEVLSAWRSPWGQLRAGGNFSTTSRMVDHVTAWPLGVHCNLLAIG